MPIHRVFKSLIILCVAVYFTLFAWNNIVDYGTNLSFVQSTLSMKYISAHSSISTRAVTSAAAQHAIYNIIILFEVFAAVLCWIGAYFYIWRENKSWALSGVFVGFIVYFLGFCTVASEWFGLWQWAKQGQHTAYLVSILLMLVLIYISQKD